MTITGDEVEAILDDMFEKRHKDLLLTKAGKFYESELAELREGLKGIPPELRGSPLATELLAADEEHDSEGRVIFYVTEAALAGAHVSDEIRADAAEIRAQLIPSLAELRDRYIDEANRAKKREPLLSNADFKAKLKRFPFVEKETLFDVASRFIAAGIKLNDLLSDRGDVVKPDRSALVTLRPSAIRVFNELREKILKEMAKDKSLPRDLETRVFGYHDTVLSMKKPPPKRAAAKSPAASPAPAAPEPPK
ncbi:MAG: hypothetical protein U0441_33475 [Polyangiaceae bacterium]